MKTIVKNSFNEDSIYYEVCENSSEIKEIHNNNLNESNSDIFDDAVSKYEDIYINYSNKKFDLKSHSSIQTTENKNNITTHKTNSSNNNIFNFSNSYSKTTRNNFENNSKNSDKKNSNSLESSNSNLKINQVIFENSEPINIDYLKANLRTIPVKSKNTSNNNKHFKTLIELQNFYIEDSSIWIVKFSKDLKYLATGSKNGIIKIFEIINYHYDNFESVYKSNEILLYLNFLNEKPYKILNEHLSDIIDLTWSSKKFNLLLSASVDHYVILWDIHREKYLKKLYHNDMVTCLSFSPNDDNIFITGCLDHFIRIYKINDDKETINSKNSSSIKSQPDYFNIEEKITALSYFPTGKFLAIGTHNGKVIVYNLVPKISYNLSFNVRNKLGKNSFGKKVTCIDFVNRNSAVITTCDSRIRLVSMPDGKLIHKYKGYVNEQSMIRAHNNSQNDLIISGSEDGFCYIWNRENKENNKKKNYSYEFFKPFSQDIVEVSLFVNELGFIDYLKKVYKLTSELFINSIIVNATNKGRIQVLLNLDENKNNL